MTATIRSFLRISVRFAGGEIEPVEIGNRGVPIAHGDRGLVGVGVGEDEEAHRDAGQRCHVPLLGGRDVHHVEVPLLVAVLVLGEEDAPAVGGPAIEHVAADVEGLESAAAPRGDRPRRGDRIDGRHEEVERAFDRPEERDPAAVGAHLRGQVGGGRQEGLEGQERLRVRAGAGALPPAQAAKPVSATVTMIGCNEAMCLRMAEETEWAGPG